MGQIKNIKLHIVTDIKVSTLTITLFITTIVKCSSLSHNTCSEDFNKKCFTYIEDDVKEENGIVNCYNRFVACRSHARYMFQFFRCSMCQRTCNACCYQKPSSCTKPRKQTTHSNRFLGSSNIWG